MAEEKMHTTGAIPEAVTATGGAGIGAASPSPFDSMASVYDSWFQSPLGRLCFQWERDAILKAARPQPGECVLDVGCGTGLFTAEFARRGAIVSGVDLSASMLEVARRRAEEEGLDIELQQGRAESLPFPDGHFDLVTTVTMLEFVRSPAVVIAEMARVLKPGGRLILAALNSRGLWAWERRRFGQESIYARAHFFSPEDLVALLAPYCRV